MSSDLAVRLGATAPTILHRPPDVVSLVAAQEAAELADSYGVADGHPLSGSQRFVLELGLGERADGSWAASTVANFAGRQGGGKSDTIVARELAGLELFGEQLIIHTAHEFPTANEAFLALAGLYENWDDLRKRVARIYYGNGTQGITLRSGQRILYKARTGGSGRGFRKADLIVYDEAQHITGEHVAASGPAKLANPNSQSWYAGSGGLETSKQAWALRRKALSGYAGRVAYAEFTAEQVSLVDGRVVSARPEVDDRDGWALANPGMGRWVREEALADLSDELGPDLFLRESMCVWEPLLGDDGSTALIPTWPALADPGSRIESHRSIALDVSPLGGTRTASFGWAGRRSDGRLHVEEIDHRTGTHWVVAAAKALYSKWNRPIRIQAGSPAAAFIAPLREAGVDVVEVSAAEHAQAVGQLLAACDPEADGLRHYPRPALDAAVHGAVLRQTGDVEVWGRRSSSVDITSLVAVTIAVGGVPAAKPAALFVAVT